jgi:hypothetical protein
MGGEKVDPSDISFKPINSSTTERSKRIALLKQVDDHLNHLTRMKK